MQVYYTLIAKSINISENIYNELIKIKPDYKSIVTMFFHLNRDEYNLIDHSNKFYYLLNGFVFDDKKEFHYLTNKKFLAFKQHNESLFVSETEKTKYNITFNLMQKHYLALSKFVHIVKHKISKNGNECDMFLNPIDNKTKVCKLLHNSKKYLFTLYDLKEIINTSLSREEYGFANVSSIKNPYDNVPFSQYNLYNIYFFFKFSYYNTPYLFNLYFMHNFNLSHFEQNNEYNIRDYNIKYLLSGKDLNKSIREIKKMFVQFNKKEKKENHFEEISPDFPKEKLFSLMKPYLQLFLVSKNSLSNREKNTNEQLLRKLLLHLKQSSPHFGRKLIKQNTITKKRYITYNSDTPEIIKINKINDHSCHINKTDNFYTTTFVNDVDDSDEENNNDVFSPIFRNSRFIQDGINTNTYPFLRDISTNNIPFFRDISTDNVPLFFHYNSPTQSNTQNVSILQFPHSFQNTDNYHLYSDQNNSESTSSIPGLIDINTNNETASETASETDSDDDINIIVDRVGRRPSFTSDSDSFDENADNEEGEDGEDV